jgi:hypothetical protein
MITASGKLTVKALLSLRPTLVLKFNIHVELITIW